MRESDSLWFMWEIASGGLILLCVWTTRGLAPRCWRRAAAGGIEARHSAAKKLSGGSFLNSSVECPHSPRCRLLST